MQLAHDQGFAVLRVLLDLRWVNSSTAMLDAWREYETRVNGLFAAGDLIGCCVYDERNFTRRDWRLLHSAHTTTLRPDTDSAASRLRVRWNGEPPALRLHGETDLGNRAALHQLLAVTARACGPLTIDATGLQFVDVAALRELLGLAAARTAPTTILCRPLLARHLRLLGAAGIATLSVAVALPANSAPPA
ncbi:MEDS domain-containing protein [Dactylosporangium sp. NBC_01737]|nr:MEDS domain-containing protein [Dactylosporangium sp. NBC_01737]